MTKDLKFLKLALKQAKKSVKQGGFPAGAVVVKDDKVISKGVGLGFKLNDPTSHPETSSIRKACKQLESTDLSDATLYASLQPCLMCFSAANWAGISGIVYGCKKTNDMVLKDYYEGKTDILLINEQNNRKIKLKFIPDFEQKSLDLVREWERLQNKVQ